MSNMNKCLFDLDDLSFTLAITVENGEKEGDPLVFTCETDPAIDHQKTGADWQQLFHKIGVVPKLGTLRLLCKSESLVVLERGDYDDEEVRKFVLALQETTIKTITQMVEVGVFMPTMIDVFNAVEVAIRHAFGVLYTQEKTHPMVRRFVEFVPGDGNVNPSVEHSRIEPCGLMSIQKIEDGCVTIAVEGVDLESDFRQYFNHLLAYAMQKVLEKLMPWVIACLRDELRARAVGIIETADQLEKVFELGPFDKTRQN